MNYFWCDWWKYVACVVFCDLLHSLRCTLLFVILMRSVQVMGAEL